jgi:hypothetical protein
LLTWAIVGLWLRRPVLYPIELPARVVMVTQRLDATGQGAAERHRTTPW